LSSVKNYFDSHSHSHAYHYDPRTYDSIFKFLQDGNENGKTKVLDLGCGDGSFIKSAHSAGMQAQFIGTDVSYAMISTARENLSDLRIDLIVCDGFKLPLKTEYQFDLIHVDSVLHHLIRKTRKHSIKLVRNLLKLLKNKLSHDGILIIEEVYYESYLIPSLTSTLIFYGLKLLNFLRLDFNKFINEIQFGLEVNFLHKRQMRILLGELDGNVELLKKDPWGTPTIYRILLLKERGHITYVYKRKCFKVG
jgi:SAM-dependent methyltransferase